jgi:ABC-type xylose transport system permease subunit
VVRGLVIIAAVMLDTYNKALKLKGGVKG